MLNICRFFNYSFLNCQTEFFINKAGSLAQLPNEILEKVILDSGIEGMKALSVVSKEVRAFFEGDRIFRLFVLKEMPLTDSSSACRATFRKICLLNRRSIGNQVINGLSQRMGTERSIRYLMDNEAVTFRKNSIKIACLEGNAQVSFDLLVSKDHLSYTKGSAFLKGRASAYIIEITPKLIDYLSRLLKGEVCGLFTARGEEGGFNISTMG